MSYPPERPGNRSMQPPTESSSRRLNGRTSCCELVSRRPRSCSGSTQPFRADREVENLPTVLQAVADVQFRIDDGADGPVQVRALIVRIAEAG